MSIPWTAEDDMKLRRLKEEENMGWKQIATHFPGRTHNACQFRWRRLTNPTAMSSTPGTSATTPTSGPASLRARKKSVSTEYLPREDVGGLVHHQAAYGGRGILVPPRSSNENLRQEFEQNLKLQSPIRYTHDPRGGGGGVGGGPIRLG
jgi:hypothetical protein